MKVYEKVGGVEYCVAHHGILDECIIHVDDDGEPICDLAEGHGGEDVCDPRALFYVVES